MVKGEGKNPHVQGLIQLGREAKLSTTVVDDSIEQSKAALSQWRGLASQYGVSQERIHLIATKIDELIV